VTRAAAPAAFPNVPHVPHTLKRLLPGVFQDQVQITYISHLIEDGADPLFVQQQAGHSWASTTAIYTTVGQDARNRMLRAALARAFEGEDGT
jgi:site-specific recombinase XerC